MIARERAFHCISNIKNRLVTSKVFFRSSKLPPKRRRSVGQRLLMGLKLSSLANKRLQGGRLLMDQSAHAHGRRKSKDHQLPLPSPSNTAFPTTAPTHSRRQQPRTPAPTSELNATSPEPGPRGRTKPRPATPAPKPGLTSPSAFQQNTGTRKMTRERNVPCTQPSRQPSAGGAADTQRPTPPAACDRNSLSAL